jgi:hypothetical protein
MDKKLGFQKPRAGNRLKELSTMDRKYMKQIVRTGIKKSGK